MKRISIKTLERKISQASVFYGKDNVSAQDFFRWHISPFLAKVLFNIECNNKLYSKLAEDINNSPPKNKLPTINQIRVEYEIKTIGQKSKTFLNKVYFTLGGLVIITTLLILFASSGDMTIWQTMLDSIGMIWVLYIISTLVIISISEAITNTYISKLSEYKILLGFLNPLFVDYKKRIEFWKNLSWQNFEHEIATRLSEFGYNVVSTKLSGDEGVDIVITNQNKKFIVQCKAMKSKIGPSFVRDFIGTIVIQNAYGGMIVSLNGFSDGSLNTSNYQNVYLLSIQDFILLDKEKLNKIIGW
ncbi:MAG: restriction endonuclease [bacterium]|nr:restriction endonuclease [bacterium]